VAGFKVAEYDEVPKRQEKQVFCVEYEETADKIIINYSVLSSEI